MSLYTYSACSIVRASTLQLALVLTTLLFTSHTRAASPTATSINSSGLGTVVTPNGTTTTITGGTRPSNGPNLFHSFRDFIVKESDTANFFNDSGLPTSNIIGRVTGGKVSDIYGTIKTDSSFGSASLYLINPFGIVFGPTASLSVGGSVHITTADYLKMAGETRFLGYLDSQSSKSTLTTEPVAAFGFFGSAPPVDLSVPTLSPASITIQAAVLQVPKGQTLSIIGGDLQMTGGSLRSPSGQVKVATVASAGEVVPSLSAQRVCQT